MPGRFNPLTALEGSFLGFPFKIARERGAGGRRGPLHEYPDRDVPYFEDLGRKAKEFDLGVYFIGDTADLQARLFDELLQKGRVGPLMLPGLRRERMKARTWSYERDSRRGGWVGFQIQFVEPGRNTYPTAADSWPHKLLDAALEAADEAFGALGEGLEFLGVGQAAPLFMAASAAVLVKVLDSVATTASGLAPSSAIASASSFTAAYGERFSGPVIEAGAFAAATGDLLSSWADALAGPSPSNDARRRAIEGLFGLYDEAAQSSWYAEVALTALQRVEVANQAAYSAAIRRGALAEAARLTASLVYSSYDDAAALRARFADAFDDELDAAARDTRARSSIAKLAGVTLRAISEGGADKAKLVPYAIARPRPAKVLAQFWYGDTGGIAGRAAELVARTGAIHPAFLPAQGERLSK